MKKSEMKHFYVLNLDSNTDEIEKYDIIPHLVEEYHKLRKKDIPQTEEVFKEFVQAEARYMWWSRVQYEHLVSPLIQHKDKEVQHKVDVYQQLMMNFDLVCELVAESIGELPWKPLKNE